MRYWIIICCLLQLPLHSRPNHRLATIRKLYRAAKEQELHENSIICNTTLAAVGLQTTRISFLHRPEQAAPKYDPYKMRYILMKVVVSYNIAASARYRTEYLYNNKGQCVFYYRSVRTTGGHLQMTRYYFHNGRVFRIQTDRSGKTTVSIRRLTGSQKKTAAKIIRESQRYRKAFRNTLKLEQVGK